MAGCRALMRHPSLNPQTNWPDCKPATIHRAVFMPDTTFARGGPMPYERAVTEAAVATCMVHRNIVTTYR